MKLFIETFATKFKAALKADAASWGLVGGLGTVGTAAMIEALGAAAPAGADMAELTRVFNSAKY